MVSGVRVIEGDAVEIDGAVYRLAGLSLQNPRSARVRLQTIIAGARSLHFIDWKKTEPDGDLLLGSLLVDGWDVAAIARREGWDAATPAPIRPTSKGELRVIDGDSVARSDGQGGEEEFRLLGLDAPEKTHRKGANDLHVKRGKQAAARLRTLVDRAQTVEVVPGAADNGNIMHHNRRFARLFLDGRDVADIAIKEGWAAPYNVDDPPDWNDPRFNFSVPRI